MVEEFDLDLEELQASLAEIAKYLHISEKQAELTKLEKQMSAPDFWNDQQAAQALMGQAALLRDVLAQFKTAQELSEEATAAFELSQLDDGFVEEYQNLCTKLKDYIDELELNTWFSGKFDHGDAIVTITPGQGGLEAQDWVEMLLKMYLRYCENRGWAYTLNHIKSGEVIGLDRATFTVSGANAYGMLRAEQGVHRLVRISPTDEKKRRQTTFAGVQVLPLIPDDIELNIKQEDLRIDVYRSSGPGGQSVNTTDSAVRITHMPTGIVVTCQNEKSQTYNKESAMKILRSRLYELEKQKREEELDKLRGPKKDIAFGSQIRNYVLFPYQLVKDLRTGYQTGDVDAVLSGGKLDPFIIAYHRHLSAQNSAK